jgi:hypothetical protein
MNDRRSLSQALDMTPKAIDFIENGLPRIHKRAAPPSDKSEPDQGEPATLVELDAAPAEAATHSDKKMRPRKEKALQAKTTEPTMLTTPVVSITTRLTQATAEALRRASLERKLAGTTPSSQQEIIELAVSNWLRDNDFMN